MQIWNQFEEAAQVSDNKQTSETGLLLRTEYFSLCADVHPNSNHCPQNKPPSYSDRCDYRVTLASLPRPTHRPLATFPTERFGLHRARQYLCRTLTEHFVAIKACQKHRFHCSLADATV